MFTDLAFLPAPAPVSGDSAGLVPQRGQTAENSEFSALLPVFQVAPRADTEGRLPELPAAQELLARLLQGGEALPLVGETLPQPELRQAGLPQPGLPQPGLPQPGLPPVSLAATLPYPASPARGGLVESLSRDMTAAHGQDLHAGSPAAEWLNDRLLSPQLAAVLTKARAVQSSVAQNPAESLAEPSDLRLDPLALRASIGDRPSPARGVSTPISTLPMDKPGWQGALGERLVWMVSHAQQRAEIKLDPPQLGRLDVHIVMQGERAQLAFAAETPVSRELLEQSLPRLRDMMAGAGIDLADVNIAHRERQAAQHSAAHSTGQDDALLAATAATDDVDRATILAVGSGLLDVFV